MDLDEPETEEQSKRAVIKTTLSWDEVSRTSGVRIRLVCHGPAPLSWFTETVAHYPFENESLQDCGVKSAAGDLANAEVYVRRRMQHGAFESDAEILERARGLAQVLRRAVLDRRRSIRQLRKERNDLIRARNQLMKKPAVQAPCADDHA